MKNRLFVLMLVFFGALLGVLFFGIKSNVAFAQTSIDERTFTRDEIESALELRRDIYIERLEAEQSVPVDSTVGTKPPKTTYNKVSFGKKLKRFFADWNWEVVGIVVGIFAGILGWWFAKKRRSKTGKMMRDIDKSYLKFKMNTKRCEAELYRFKDIVDEKFRQGQLDDGSFAVLEKRIEDYMKEIREQIINEKFGGLHIKLRGEIDKMLEDGKVSQKEYDHFVKVLKTTTGVDDLEKENLQNLIENWRKNS